MQVFDRESGLAPALEPPAQRVDIFVTVGVQEESHPGARRLSRLRAVEDHLAVFLDQLMWVVQRFGEIQRAPGIPYGVVSMSSAVLRSTITR